MFLQSLLKKDKVKSLFQKQELKQIDKVKKLKYNLLLKNNSTISKL